MNYKVFGDSIVVRLEKGEELVSAIKELCKAKRITAGSISGLGATNHIIIGLFNTTEKKYYSKEVNEELEITSLTGNISVMNDEPYLHIHGTFGDIDGKVIGGHLNEAVISATCEIYIHRVNGVINRVFDENIGLNLMDI